MSSPYLLALKLCDERVLTEWQQLHDCLKLRGAPLELLECVIEVIVNLEDIYNQADGLYYSEQQQTTHESDIVPMSKRIRGR